MNELLIPQGPWHNPILDEGIYDAEIRYINKGTYGKDGDTYLQFVFWLIKEEKYFVTNMYFPEDKPDSKSVLRLNRLCQCVGCIPQDALDAPEQFMREELKITVKMVSRPNGSGVRQYRDVDLFFPADCQVDDSDGVVSSAG